VIRIAIICHRQSINKLKVIVIVIPGNHHITELNMRRSVQIIIKESNNRVFGYTIRKLAIKSNILPKINNNNK